MTPIPYTPEHYPTLCQWWTAHNWTAPPQSCLTAQGLIIPDQAAAFLWRDPTSTLAAQEFLVTNPSNTPLQSFRAIVTLSKAIADLARLQGATALFTSCVQPSLARTLQTTGFLQTDTNVIHMIRPL
jgi:hypothetical protein